MPRVFEAAWWRTMLGHEGRRRILGNIGWLTGEWVILKVTLLVSVVVMARHLGPERFGLFSYSLSLVQLLIPLSTLGIATIVVRDLIQRPSDAGVLLGSALGMRLVGGVAGVVCLMVAVNVLRPGDTLTSMMVAVMSLRLVFWAAETLDYWFQSQLRSKYKVMANNAAMVVYLLMVVILAAYGAPLVWFGAAFTAEALLFAAFISAAYALAARGVPGWRFSLPEAGRILKEGWPLMFSSIAVMIYMRIGQVMLGQLAGDAAVGQYSVAVRFSEGWYLLSTAVANSVFPALVEARKAGDGPYYRAFGKVSALLSMASVAIAVLVTVLAQPLVRFFFGSAYGPAAPVLAIHIWAGVFVFLGNLAFRWVVMERWQVFFMYATIAGVAVNIGLNYALIPVYGGVGAAVATVISYACTGYFSYAFFRPSRRLWNTMTRALFMPWSFFVGKGASK